jgi:arylsulfatase
MFEAPQRLNLPMMFNLIKDPKELYPLDRVDLSEAWFMPVVLERLVAFKKSLIIEPPIRLGTPDPYLPGR